MENPSQPTLHLTPENRVNILLTEYQAIEQMHAHYDVINMTMMAFITAGVFTIWGLVIQSAFQSHRPIDDPIFVNSTSVFALALFFSLSFWIRYMTIHRCIIIEKLNRSHEIEKELDMHQNSVFRYDAARLSAPLDSTISLRTRPGGHTLELLLYFSLSTFGGLTALIFEWHIRAQWGIWNYPLFGLLLICPPIALLWMGFCKFDAIRCIHGSEVGFPWNVLFMVIRPINQLLRWLLNLGRRQP